MLLDASWLTLRRSNRTWWILLIYSGIPNISLFLLGFAGITTLVDTDILLSLSSGLRAPLFCQHIFPNNVKKAYHLDYRFWNNRGVWKVWFWIGRLWTNLFKSETENSCLSGIILSQTQPSILFSPKNCAKDIFNTAYFFYSSPWEDFQSICMQHKLSSI